MQNEIVNHATTELDQVLRILKGYFEIREYAPNSDLVSQRLSAQTMLPIIERGLQANRCIKQVARATAPQALVLPIAPGGTVVQITATPPRTVAPTGPQPRAQRNLTFPILNR